MNRHVRVFDASRAGEAVRLSIYVSDGRDLVLNHTRDIDAQVATVDELIKPAASYAVDALAGLMQERGLTLQDIRLFRPPDDPDNIVRIGLEHYTITPHGFDQETETLAVIEMPWWLAVVRSVER